MITFAVGLFIGYWIYPARMFYKLYKINKKLVQIEKDFMDTREQFNGKQWNEDNL